MNASVGEQMWKKQGRNVLGRGKQQIACSASRQDVVQEKSGCVVQCDRSRWKIYKLLCRIAKESGIRVGNCTVKLVIESPSRSVIVCVSLIDMSYILSLSTASLGDSLTEISSIPFPSASFSFSFSFPFSLSFSLCFSLVPFWEGDSIVCCCSLCSSLGGFGDSVTRKESSMGSPKGLSFFSSRPTSPLVARGVGDPNRSPLSASIVARKRSVRILSVGILGCKEEERSRHGGTHFSK